MSDGPVARPVATPPDLDLTTESVPPKTEAPETLPYNPGPQRERMRGALALVLLALFGLVIVFATSALWLQRIAIEDLKSFLEMIFTPLIALVGSVIGFYYGGKSSN